MTVQRSGTQFLGQKGFAWMATSRHEQPVAPDALHYAFNMMPLDPGLADGFYQMRPGFQPPVVGTAGGSAIRAFGQLTKSDGTQVTWFLSSSSGLWTIDYSGLTYTNVVTSANFTTATITLAAATHYWCLFNGKVVFTDGTNTPWTWDGGSGAGSLVELTNAPVAYGRPTVYYAKLFFIKNSARNTIVWSEENDATTGYEAGGFNNAWSLFQTTTAPLLAIQATNQGLYYFRSASIGVIRGAVNDTFQTSGVHDAVSASVGIAGPAAVAVADDDLWFADNTGFPAVLPSGGTPQSLMPTWLSTTNNLEPFGFDDIGWTRSGGSNITDVTVVAIPASHLQPYRTVWFNVPSATLTASRAFLVCDAERRRPLYWCGPFTGAIKPYLSAIFYDGAAGQQWLPGLVVSADGTLVLAIGEGSCDQNSNGTNQNTTYRLIGAPLGATELSDYRFDRAAFVMSSSASMTPSVQLLTSRANNSGAVSAAQTPTLNTGGDLERIAVGLNQSGRWARPVLSFTTNGTRTWRVAGWRIAASPIAATAGIP